MLNYLNHLFDFRSVLYEWELEIDKIGLVMPSG